MWPIISGADQLKTSSRVVYSDIVTTLRSFKNSSSEQILRDLPRSFPGHPYFDSPEGTRALGNVLTAFSWLNPAIGYTQSMNFWAGLLLIMVSSEEVRLPSPFLLFLVLNTLTHALLLVRADCVLVGRHSDRANSSCSILRLYHAGHHRRQSSPVQLAGDLPS